MLIMKMDSYFDESSLKGSFLPFKENKNLFFAEKVP